MRVGKDPITASAGRRTARNFWFYGNVLPVFWAALVFPLAENEKPA